jgi:hypothetical protein
MKKQLPPITIYLNDDPNPKTKKEIIEALIAKKKQSKAV